MIIDCNVLKLTEMRNILDLSVDMENTIDLIMRKWEYDIISSDKLGYEFDMVAYLFSLLRRNAIIVLPKYKAVTSTNLNEKMIIIPENRHGRLIGIQGNSKTFSFTIRIIDMNVINGDKLGEVRCFRLTDPEGSWYSGLDKLQVVTADQDNKLTENKMYGDDIKFDFFIDPRRWIQLYSPEYFITKCLMNRLKLEASYYYDCIKLMLAEGIQYPEKKEPSWPTTEQKGEKRLIKLFTVNVDHPDYVGQFPSFPSTQNMLIELTNRRNKIIYSITPKLNFIIRAIEYAFFKSNQPDQDIPEEIKEKIKSFEWKKIKLKRTEWDELNLGEIKLLKRIYEKEEVM